MIIQQARKYAGKISFLPLVSIYFQSPLTSWGSIFDFRIDIEKMRKTPLDTFYISKKIIFNVANDHPTSQKVCWKNIVSASGLHTFSDFSKFMRLDLWFYNRYWKNEKNALGYILYLRENHPQRVQWSFNKGGSMLEKYRFSLLFANIF